MKPLLLIAAFAALSAIAADTPVATPESVAKSYATTLTRITDKPKAVGPEFAAMCDDSTARAKYGPHVHHFVHHYRNQSAMHPAANFAPGSVLVKEKLEAAPNAGKPSVRLVTGMIKQPAGTSPKTGDWQFFVSRDGKVETAKMESCAGCHSGAKRDYVFTAIPQG